MLHIPPIARRAGRPVIMRFTFAVGMVDEEPPPADLKRAWEAGGYVNTPPEAVG